MQPRHREELFHFMVEKLPCKIQNVTGTICSIEMEDGSGYSFNVRLCIAPKHYHTVYILFPKNGKQLNG